MDLYADIDVDVKLVLYGLLARIDGDSSYLHFRQQIDDMYELSESSSDDDEDSIDYCCNEGEDNTLPVPQSLQMVSAETPSVDGENSDHIAESGNDPNEESDLEDAADLDEDIPCPKTKGELSLDDLPPIGSLSISPDGALEQVGEVGAILDKIVVVKAFRFSPALDMDTILFLASGQPIGLIFETFGPVIEPMYLVRFNLGDDIKRLSVSEGCPVYYTPDSRRHTKYVFVDHLRKVKGSDASWEDNNEPPTDCLDYSDDEEERQAKAAVEFEKRRNHYARFLPQDKRGEQNEPALVQKELIFTDSQLPPNVGSNVTMPPSSTKKNTENKVKMRSKLVGAALARARRKANDGTSAETSLQASSSDIISIVEEAVKNNPSLLSSIISSAVSAAGGQQTQPGLMQMPLSLPVMLPPTANLPHQPRFLPSTSYSCLQNSNSPSQNVQHNLGPDSPKEEPRRRLIDPRFMKKQS